jgi:hypothetical protein
MNIESNPTVATSARTRRTVLSVAIAVIATIPIATGTSAASDEPTSPDTTESTVGAGPDGLVTEEVEPGVERIISDDAGHDLDERHPTYRYDMDNVAVTPDGNVWLWTGYHDSDNEANPPGGFLWALGQPGMSNLPDFFCLTEGFGVLCIDPVRVEGEETTYLETTYLAGTPITAVSVAPDGTVWAVGGYGGENGGLYRIIHD